MKTVEDDSITEGPLVSKRPGQHHHSLPPKALDNCKDITLINWRLEQCVCLALKTVHSEKHSSVVFSLNTTARNICLPLQLKRAYIQNNPGQNSRKKIAVEVYSGL